MEFERTKFEIIQKCSKKFSKITSETKDEILNDIKNIDFSKIIEEIVKNIIESKFELKDINSMIIVVSHLHQIYDKFTGKFIESLKKMLNDSYNESRKPSKTEDEEEKKITKRKGLTRMYIESYLYGIITDFTGVKEIFAKILSSKNTKEQFFQEFPVLVYLMKVFGLSLFGIKTKKMITLINEGALENFEIETINKKEINDKYYQGFKEFYMKKILVYLEEEHKILNDLEKKNFETFKKTENNNADSNIAYQKERNFYMKYISLINSFAEVMNFEIPDLANEKTFRYEQKKKAETKLEKINKYDPFSNENEYFFYTSPIQLSEQDLNFYIQNRSFNKSSPSNYDYYKKIDTLIQSQVAKCETKEAIDEISLEIIKNNYTYLNFKKSRSYFLETLFKYQKNGSYLPNYLKISARLISNLFLVYKEIQDEVTDLLLNDFYYYLKDENKNLYFDEKIYNAKSICELVKFSIFSIDNILEIIKYILEDFTGNNIDILCAICDNCGRFLYLNDYSHVKFSEYIDTMKKMSHHSLLHDERAAKSIMNSINICRPQEKTLHKKVKVRSIEEEYIRFLVYQIMNKDTVAKVAVLLRKMDWEKYENLIFKVIFKYLVRSNENQIKICCAMISKLKDYHPMFIFNLINIILEQIRIGLERNDFNDNQHKIILCSIIGNFYLNKIINNEIVYYTMYMILLFNPEWSFGIKELKVDNPLDSSVDTFRVLMIVTILEICGQKLNQKHKKAKLDEFIQFLQIYILTKQYLPLDVENRVTTCLNHLNQNTIYNDFHAALRDSRKYQGLNFVLETDEINKDSQNEVKNETNEKKEENINEVKGNVDDDADFKRSEDTNVKEINVDEEIQKIITESMNKAKRSGSMMNVVINPLADIKKKDIGKIETGKLRLFTKKDNKIIMKEVNIIENKKKEEDEDISEEDEEDDS